MSTYNGAAFLEEQLESLFSQTYQDWELLVRDDGSQDKTLEIVKRYAAQYPEKISLTKDSQGNLGASQSFGAILQKTKSPYIMLCDQDDGWLPDKISLSLAKMMQLENSYGEVTPLLIHSDLKVVDDRLRAIAPSLWQFQQNNPYLAKQLHRSLMQNAVTGCTVMINKSLKAISQPIPQQAAMHDWWLALVAIAFGQVGLVEQPTVLYRQHSQNEIGAQGWTGNHLAAKALRFWQREELKTSLADIEQQAQAFAEQYGHGLSAKQLAATRSLATLSRQNPLEKRLRLIRHQTLKTGFSRNLGLFIRI